MAIDTKTILNFVKLKTLTSIYGAKIYSHKVDGNT